MKKILLGSTAMVAAASLTSVAHAAQGIQLGLGGYYQGAAGLILSQDDDTGEPGNHTRNVVFRQDVEVHFKGETTLDNGLTVGARIEMEGQQSDDQIDEVWAYFKGGWGQVRFGDDDEAYEQLGYLIPSASNGLFGVDSPHIEFANSKVGGASALQTNTTVMKLTGDATKILYFSPTFAGFNFAVSFAPDRRGEDTYSYWSGPGGTTSSQDTGQIQNVFAAALNFTHDFNGTKLVAGVGAGEGQWENTLGGQDDTSWTVRGHLIVSFSGFTIGGAGSYQANYRNTTATDDVDKWVAGGGVTYNWDAWTVGLAYSHGSYEFASEDNVDTLDIVEFTGRYDLAPGIDLEAMAGYHQYINDANSDGDDHTWEMGVGFNIGF
ncbi:MAG TPA: porin [Hypericibacter adhaerens]|uniref:Porin n=1 Tax=Hypericibacter adhaerens TaxID=2602016 RepID=A0A5J6N4Y8_9PROT|nr:porin [Hypericibacter adhaerens]QEX25132.1 porin [Hypericibacter adhaerens]HWA42053.1 porin [Hypericibacter adhaerens]